MKFSIDINKLETLKSDCIVIGVFESNILSKTAEKINHITNNYITNILNHGDINGKIHQCLMLYNIPHIASQRILLVGCGKKNELDEYQYNNIIDTVIKTLIKTNIQESSFFLTEFDVNNKNIYWKIRYIIENIHNNTYIFEKLKKKKNKKIHQLQHINFCINSDDDIKKAKLAIKHGIAITIGIKESKDLANLPPNICNPIYIATCAKKLANSYNNINTIILNEKELKLLKMNAYLAVGQGSKNESLMSIIEYKGDQNISAKPIVLIGKGLTFDSGGISIKSANNMEEMKFDMCGAATVYGIMHFLAYLQLPIHVISILACAENMPGGNAYRPGDILTTMSGKTVEIINTDAEGRLVLCDVLTYVDRFNPDIVIDVATLTGACVIALGKHYSGLLSNNDQLAEEIIHASIETGDKAWRLPLDKKFYKQLKSTVADISHVGGRDAGTITAGCFLEIFANKYHWAHLDIAGTAWDTGNKKYATGRPLTLLAQFLLNRTKLIYT
uniref:Probable cytosol aminopeptidase n=1 Tax=Candidatus Aschnera chinzeii TaxID=1485666 RepID=A0AAT9G4D0_9ENTR|nr:MAG: leucyl aminopeptidase [Candidatus Aschnera chinzeii]